MTDKKEPDPLVELLNKYNNSSDEEEKDKIKDEIEVELKLFKYF